MTTDLDTFESTLLDGLRAHVETRAPRPRRRRRGLLVSAVGVATAAVAGIVFVPDIGTSPAFSVREGNAGHIEVTVNRPEDAAGLEKALDDVGIESVINYTPNGGHCVRPGMTTVEHRGVVLSIGSNMFRIDVAPGTIRDGETLVIDVSSTPIPPEPEQDGVTDLGGTKSWVQADIVTGPVTPCVATLE